MNDSDTIKTLQSFLPHNLTGWCRNCNSFTAGAPKPQTVITGRYTIINNIRKDYPDTEDAKYPYYCLTCNYPQYTSSLPYQALDRILFIAQILANKPLEDASNIEPTTEGL